MAFCTNCGQQVDDGAKFCANCGTPTMQNASVNDEKRRTFYDGEIHKCPGCNEILKSFEINCPYCGYELRDVKTSSAVKEFVLKLENLGLVGEKSKKSFDVNERYKQITEVSEIADKKINLIRNFNVPNSKEDMIEFMILASSNIKTSVYDSFDSDFQSKDAKEINEAWISKVQQVYDKARVSCFADETFNEIERIYNDVNKKIFESKKNNRIKWALIASSIVVGWIFIAILGSIFGPKLEEKELQRLENIVLEVQDALDDDEYQHALNLADSIDYQNSDVDQERKWDIEREYWVNKVLKEAEVKGIYLEYTFTPDIDNTN